MPACPLDLRLIGGTSTSPDKQGFSGGFDGIPQDKPIQRGQSQAINPKFGLGNLPMFGTTVNKSEFVTPNQDASVAAYSSTEVVGINRPCPASSGLPSDTVGKRP